MGVEDMNTLSGEFLFIDPEEIVNKKQIVPYEKLKNVEERRRKILKRTELPFWRILGYFEGTCLKAMVVDWLFWVTITVYIALRLILRDENLLPDAVDLGNTDLSVIGGFLSFFLVLFVNQSNIRFHDMYKDSMKCPKNIFDVTQMIAPTFDSISAGRIVRYLNAAHIAGYVGLSRAYSEQELFNKLNEEYQFLNIDELKRIQQLGMDHGPEAFHELVGWCMSDIETAYQNNVIDARSKSALNEKILSFRSSMDDLYDYCDQPIHFFYIHFLCLLSAVYLPLFAADSAFNAGTGNDLHWTWDILSGLIVLVQAIFVIGLRLLGQKLSDPYGDDLEDLSVMHYIRDTWKRSNELLLSNNPNPKASSVIEEALKKHRKVGLGSGFINNNDKITTANKMV